MEYLQYRVRHALLESGYNYVENISIATTILYQLWHYALTDNWPITLYHWKFCFVLM